MERQVRAAVRGSKAVLRVSVSAIKGAGGEHLGMLVVVDDLTEMVKAQRALAWQEVARRMAHEIKNPLTPIQLSTERMRKKWREQEPEFGPVFEGATEAIIREVNGLKRLVDEFSRLGKMPELAMKPTDLRAMVEEAVGLYKESGGLTVSLDAAVDLPPMELDGEQMKRAIINLIDNAREAMSGRGRVWVRLARDPSARKVLISVADEGPGIREEDREKLFLPYFSTKKNGTGLGLAIADKIVADHGGSIKVMDNAPKGSVFVIELPFKEV